MKEWGRGSLRYAMGEDSNEAPAGLEAERDFDVVRETRERKLRQKMSEKGKRGKEREVEYE